MNVGELRDELAVSDDGREVVIITGAGVEPVIGMLMEFGGNVALVCKTGTRPLWDAVHESERESS